MHQPSEIMAIEEVEGKYLVVAVQLEILFRLESIWIWLFWLRLNTFSDISHDLSCAEHAVGVKAVIPVRSL